MKIRQRPIDPTILEACVERGLSPSAAAVVAGRFADASQAAAALFPELKQMSNPGDLPDVDRACSALMAVVEAGCPIVCAVDIDNDGVSSAAVLYRALVEVFGVPDEQVHIYSGNRFTEGYGLSDGLAQRIIDDFPDQHVLVLTADMGSSDESRIDKLRDHGIAVVVTDHHAIPAAGIPRSAVAVVNPTRDDAGAFSDPLIAGCAVAWFVMARLFTVWSDASPERPCFQPDTIQASRRELMGLLGFCASGTVGDCVSLSQSVNNRLICQMGIRFITQGKPYPCWQAIQSLLQPGEGFNSSHISFLLAPLINSAGRLTDAHASLRFLITNDPEEAGVLLEELQAENGERKRIEAGLRVHAVNAARKQYDAGATCAVVYLEEGHPGVQGICASRVVEEFGKPCCILSPKRDGSSLITGSLRSVDGINIRDALEFACAALPDDADRRFGGHYFAAGVTISRDDLEAFSVALDDASAAQARAMDGHLEPVVEHDGPLHLSNINMALIADLFALGPYGRGFPLPAFSITGVVKSAKPMGKQGNHTRIVLAEPETNATVTAVQFFVDRIDDYSLPVAGQTITVIGEIAANYYKGTASPQVIVRCLA